MKKIVLLVIMLFCLSGCGQAETHSNKDDDTYRAQFANGYFTVLENWNSYYYIIFANDTKVKYFVYLTAHGFGITPLYNVDGSLQIYGGD